MSNRIDINDARPRVVMEDGRVKLVWMSAQGPAGPQGDPGTPGSDGADGADGADGISVLPLLAAPTAGDGVDGQPAINLVTGDTWLKTAGVWAMTGNLKGPAGEDGADGADGADGLSILGLATDPGPGDGVDGQTAINLVSGDTFLKSGGSWTLQGNFKGPTGADGADAVPFLAGAWRIDSDFAGDANHDVVLGAGSFGDLSFAGMTKRADASWTAGDNGGLMDSASGVISANEWIRLALISNDSSGAGDVIGTDGDAALAVPSGWSFEAWLGAPIRTDGSGNIVPFRSHLESPQIRVMELTAPIQIINTGIVSSAPAAGMVSGWAHGFTRCIPKANVSHYHISSGGTGISQIFVRTDSSSELAGNEQSRSSTPSGVASNTVNTADMAITDTGSMYLSYVVSSGSFRAIIYLKGFREALT